MTTNLRFHSLGLLAAALAGCAVPSSPDAAREESATTAQAQSAPYVQTFDPDFQAILFQPSAGTPIDWVILHVTIDGDRTANVRMPQTGTSAAAGPTYEIESLPTMPGDTITYSFTYSSSGLAYDTPVFTLSLPTDWAPPRLFTRATGHRVEVVSATPLAWADVHYRINGSPTLNARLTPLGSTYVQTVSLAPGDVLEYSVTYATSAAVLETATTRFTAGAGARFVVDRGDDGAAGDCVANGGSDGRCNLRAAVLAAQSAIGPVAIDLAVDSVVDAGSIAVTARDLVIESAAGGAIHAVTGTGASRLFDVASGATLALERLAIASFRAMDAGGAIRNLGSLDLDGVTVSNNVTHCFGVGAMTAFATCSGGAIDNAGDLTLGGGTTFANNAVTADASTAMYTTATALGGAIASSGAIAIVGPVSFTSNTASASAHSGVHPAPIGGASASASGGAIATSGTLTVIAPAGSCRFTDNAASAAGSTVHGGTTLVSAGGAIENTGTMSAPPGTCVFSGNQAQKGSDVDGG